MTDTPPSMSTPDTQGAPVATPREKRLRIVLLASLAVNLLVIGAVVGAGIAIKRHGPPHGGRGAEDYGLMGFTRTLPSDRRKEIRKELKQERAKLRPLVDEIEQARDDAASVLASEPFNRDALRAASDKVTEREQTLKAAGLDMFLNHAEKLTAAERKSLSEWWKTKRPRRRPPTDDKPDADDPPPQ
ncbi:MAG: periplasmic heavy metal sensor [Hyphomicrobium sp.]